MLVYPGNPHVHYADFQALGAHRNMATDLSPEFTFAEQMTVQTFAFTHAPGMVVQSRDADEECRRDFKNHHGFNHHQSELWASEQFNIFPNYNRSEEHTSELQSLMRISYAVFCLKKKKKIKKHINTITYKTKTKKIMK